MLKRDTNFKRSAQLKTVKDTHYNTVFNRPGYSIFAILNSKNFKQINYDTK